MSTDADEKESLHSGLFNSIKAAASTLLAIIETRVELLSTELEEERIRLTSMLMWSFAALFCAALGIIFATMLFVVALWDEHRLLAVGIPATVFLLAAVIAALVVASKAQARPKLFAASVAELSKDREQLDHE